MRKIVVAILTWLLKLVSEPENTEVQFLTLDYRANKMTIQIDDSQKVVLTVAGHNAAGNVVALSSVPAWVSSDETVATIVAADDGLSASVVSGTATGTATITVSADGFTATDYVVVVRSPLASLVIAEGTPEAK